MGAEIDMDKVKLLAGMAGAELDVPKLRAQAERLAELLRGNPFDCADDLIATTRTIGELVLQAARTMQKCAARLGASDEERLEALVRLLDDCVVFRDMGLVGRIAERYDDDAIRFFVARGLRLLNGWLHGSDEDPLAAPSG